MSSRTLAVYRRSWRDAGGIPHDPRDAPRRQRVVSLVPSLTESLCAVGGRTRMAGCTAFCIRPAGLLKDRAVAKVGGTKTVLKEKVLKLKPDLLLLNLEENTLEDIAYFKTRVECYINGVRTLEEGLESMRELAALIGPGPGEALEAADNLARQGHALLAAVRARVAQRETRGARRPALFYAIWRDPWMTINGDTFIHSHLEACGAKNVFGAETSRYPEVTLEEVSRRAPDAVWLPSEPYRFKPRDAREISKLHALPAAQRQRIELVDGDAVCWFGARQLEGTAATYRQLWRKDVNAGPLPVDF